MAGYVAMRRRYVFLDEWLTYATIAGLYLAQVPTPLFCAAAALGAAANIEAYNSLWNLYHRYEKRWAERVDFAPRETPSQKDTATQ